MDNKNNIIIGYSKKINDPAFEKYLKNKKRWAWIFSFILSTAAIIGFYIYGENSVEMDNPEALFIGAIIGCMFLIIAFLNDIKDDYCVCCHCPLLK